MSEAPDRYEAPRIRPIRSTLEQAFGGTCGPGNSPSGSSVCWPAGSAPDPGICTDGSGAHHGECGAGDSAFAGACKAGSSTGRCAAGDTAFFQCQAGGTYASSLVLPEGS